MVDLNAEIFRGICSHAAVAAGSGAALSLGLGPAEGAALDEMNFFKGFPTMLDAGRKGEEEEQESGSAVATPEGSKLDAAISVLSALHNTLPHCGIQNVHFLGAFRFFRCSLECPSQLGGALDFYLSRRTGSIFTMLIAEATTTLE